MFRYAEITSLIHPIQELQDRISLEVPAKFIKEESIRESGNQRAAEYEIVSYAVADGAAAGEELDVQAVVERLAHDVFDPYEVEWDIQHRERNPNVFSTALTISFPDQQRQAATARQANDAQAVVPLTIYADQSVFNVATDGNTFSILLDGTTVLEDAPSAQYALGAMVPMLRDALTEIEANNGMEPSGSNDFLAGIAATLIDANYTDEAKEHFVKFYELTTLRDWAAAEEDPED